MLKGWMYQARKRGLCARRFRIHSTRWGITTKSTKSAGAARARREKKDQMWVVGLAAALLPQKLGEDSQRGQHDKSQQVAVIRIG